jgi:cellobiose-specific phosphotransferase system component IIC
MLLAWTRRLKRIHSGPRDQWHLLSLRATEWLSAGLAGLFVLQFTAGGLAIAREKPDQAGFAACAMLAGLLVAVISVRAYARAMTERIVLNWRNGKRW